MFNIVHHQENANKILRFHLIPVKMTIFKKIIDTKYLEEWRRKNPFFKITYLFHYYVCMHMSQLMLGDRSEDGLVGLVPSCTVMCFEDQAQVTRLA